jgi:hypothetical protein
MTTTTAFSFPGGNFLDLFLWGFFVGFGWATGGWLLGALVRLSQRRSGP